MKGETNNELNDKQLLFCREYLVDFHGTNAAIRAGYSANSAAEQAARLLADSRVQAKLNELRDQIAERIDLQIDKLMREWYVIGFANIRNYFEPGNKLKDITQMSPEATAAISELTITEIQIAKDVVKVTKKLKMHSKTTALIEMGKRIGFYAPEMPTVQRIIVEHVDGTMTDKELKDGTHITTEDNELPPGVFINQADQE